MNEVVRFTTPGGEEMVILPAAEYLRFVEATEHVADIAAYDEVKRKLASGEEEMVPSQVDRLLSGENRVRVWREYRGLTSSALADRARIGQGFVSQIETGKREGTVDTLRKIARALDLTLDDLVG